MNYMYYGRDDGVIPKDGVYCLMIDEHVKKILDNAAVRHEEQLQGLREDIKREVKASIRTLSVDLKENESKTRTNYSDIVKLFDEVKKIKDFLTKVEKI